MEDSMTDRILSSRKTDNFMKFKYLICAFAVAAAMLSLSSCKAPQKVTYFQDDAQLINMAQVNPIKVTPSDKLSIIVKTKDPSVSELFNKPVYSYRIGTSNPANGGFSDSFVSSGNEGMATYTVDPQGCIDFPLLGNIHVAGMTRSELAAFIKGEIMGRNLAKDPIVTVDFLSAGINIIGEVTNPGRYNVNIDNLNILDAISLAGDLTITGLRDKVKVIRHEGDQMKVYTLDLTNLAETAQSPAYYLQQNDVVYVEPNDMKKRQTTVNGNNALSTSFWISVASLITTAVTTVGVFVK